MLSASNGDGNLLSSHFISDAEHYKVALGRLEKNSGCGLADSGDLYWPYFNLERNGANKMKTFIPFVVPRVAKAALKGRAEDQGSRLFYFPPAFCCNSKSLGGWVGHWKKPILHDNG